MSTHAQQQQMAEAEQDHPDHPDHPDEPSLEDCYPVGAEVEVSDPFSGRILGAGVVVGYTTGLVDQGSPESGPGPLVEESLIKVRITRSDYRVMKVDAVRSVTVDQLV